MNNKVSPKIINGAMTFVTCKSFYVRLEDISNIYLDQLKQLYQHTTDREAYKQNNRSPNACIVGVYQIHLLVHRGCLLSISSKGGKVGRALWVSS